MRIKSFSFYRPLLLTAALAWCHLSVAEDSAPVTKEVFAQPEANTFTSDFSGIKKGVAPSAVGRMTDPFLKRLAGDIKSGAHDTQSRLKVYEAYEPVDTLAKRLKTSAYSQFENPTGIYFQAGDQAIVHAEGIGKEPVKLKIYNFGSRKTGAQTVKQLENGINIIDLPHEGLAYIDYYTDEYRKAPKVKIHMLNGQVNGVFDSSKNTNEDWKKMISAAPCEMFDIVGKHVQLVYPVEKLREVNPDRGFEMINRYDQIINWQHEIMGLVKYNIQPKNRMLGRAIWKGFMHADGLGAAFHKNTMDGLANPDKIPTNSWGIAHEFGHVNQTRPGLKWVSTTEVTNNLFSAWANYKLDPGNMRLEAERTNGGDGNVIGGRFNAYLNAALINGENWLCQKGPDRRLREGLPTQEDHFVKLCPLWQLQLYFMAARQGNPDFLADVFEATRKTDDKGKTNGDFQLAFMKNVCDATKQDLTDFFIKTGMLKPIDQDLDDYSIGRMTITQKDCDKLAQYAKRYPKPASPVIYYISVNSADAYKNRLPLSGKTGAGVEKGEKNTLTVSHNAWQNAAAFETYAGDKLVKIAMTGTGSPDNKSTLVQYPEGATRVMAVSWDGKCKLVYGK